MRRLLEAALAEETPGSGPAMEEKP